MSFDMGASLKDVEVALLGDIALEEAIDHAYPQTRFEDPHLRLEELPYLPCSRGRTLLAHLQRPCYDGFRSGPPQARRASSPQTSAALVSVVLMLFVSCCAY